jgi:hypothetical protein
MALATAVLGFVLSADVDVLDFVRSLRQLLVVP